MERLSTISTHLQSNRTAVTSCLEYWRFDELLSAEDNKARKEVRAFLDKEIRPYISHYVEKAEFPHDLIEKFKKCNPFQLFLKKPFGEGMSTMGAGMIAAELARCDAGIGTFCIVQYGLLMYTIETLGSEEQKQKWLPQLRDIKKIGGWGLTEVLTGSNAAQIDTTAKKVPGGWIINGNKRWIGNGNRDLIVCWAQNEETKKVNAFIVEMDRKGVKSEVIQHKLALRIVQNCEISFDNVFIPDENRLPKAEDFGKSTGQILLHSRLFVAWIAAGIAMGVYDSVIKYATQRKQFGVPIGSFQLQQEKLFRVMQNTQMILLCCQRLSQLHDQGKMTMGMVAGGKAWCSERLREVARLGREIMGGNGIIHDNYAMKALADAEAVYTYEGTYDMNALVVGRELTGVSAFKSKK